MERKDILALLSSIDWPMCGINWRTHSINLGLVLVEVEPYVDIGGGTERSRLWSVYVTVDTAVYGSTYPT